MEEEKAKENLMLLHSRPALLALVWLLGYELLIYKPETLYFVLIFLFLLSVFGTLKVIGGWRFVFLPTFYFCGAFLLFLFISSDWFRQAYALVTTLAFYFSLLSIYRAKEFPLDETARRMNYVVTLGTIFLWSASLFGIYLNQRLDFFSVIPLVYVGVFLVTRQFLGMAIIRDKDKQGEKINLWWYSLLLAYCMALLTWSMFFLPFGYLTLGSLLAVSYFVLSNYLVAVLNSSYRKISLAVDALVFLLAIGLVVVTTRWDIVEQI